MPKVKRKSIVMKRFKLTKNGKVLHRAQGARHLRRKKSKSRQRRQDTVIRVENSRFARMIRRFMVS